VNLVQEDSVNVGLRLSEMATESPNRLAIVEAIAGKTSYRECSFRELEDQSNRIAAGLRIEGVQAGKKLVLLVPPGIDFITLFFAMLKCGAVTILIDPGMRRDHLIDCLADAEPDGFVAIPKVQAARVKLRRRFPNAKLNVTVGTRWLSGGTTLAKLLKNTAPMAPVSTNPADPAAIIFTSGSTGPPKGVLYSHGNFDQQVTEIRDKYQIQPGEVDLSGFPLFALFNAAMGVTTLIPEMDFTKPASADPQKLIAIAEIYSATQAFGSPALLNAVAQYCETEEVRLHSLRRVLSAGAPVPSHVLRRIKNVISDEGEIHTPYGATESLPVATISAAEVLEETAAKSDEGAGTCVGKRFPGIQWKVIRIDDEPLDRIQDCEELSSGEIGELIVQGGVVTREYVTQVDANRLHKVRDGDRYWHRMGDVGYLDDQDRFWFCGRKSQRVTMLHTTMYTIPCEGIANTHPRVYRSALVQTGVPGLHRAVLVVELWPDQKLRSPADKEQLYAELWDLFKSHPTTRNIHDILVHDSLPVDVRHNSKIFREQLAEWATQELK
jgi:acyl-CoA synthetase (AMP-forming)/AMP-acid ligase II